MAGTSEHSGARKGLIPFDHNWQRLTRDDIYRQRVYGTESGASEFIPLNDKSQLSVLSMIVYIIFIVATVQFTWDRVNVAVNYDVNSAIRASLESTTFVTDPTPKVWEDIENIDDLKNWLLYAFPNVLTPEVQGFNFPIDQVRFTLRRIKLTPNTNDRFNNLAPTIWASKHGITLGEASSDKDNTEAFGAYRNTKTLGGVNWGEKESYFCDGGRLLDQLEEVRYSKDRVVKMCKDWCEELVADSFPCRCWTLSGQYKCEFYYMSRDTLQNYSTSPLLPRGSAAAPDELAPRVQQGQRDVTVYWPRLKVFTYNNEGDDLPGFVLLLDLHSQEAIISSAKAANETPPTQQQAVFRTLRDWLDGGFLSRNATALAIDFVTMNPNQEVFTWIQLNFQMEASGHITKELQLSSLYITAARRAQTDVSMWDDFSILWDGVYFALVIAYVMWEFKELLQRGIRYFYTGWNLLTVVSLMLHIATLVSRYVYLLRAEFAQTPTIARFATQATAFQEFLLISSVNLLFVWVQLLHYLNDIVPRIGVLVDTMYRSVTPILFLVIIVIDLLFGFVVWANLMFGKSVGAFKDIPESVYSCGELLFGQVDPYYEVARVYPGWSIVFFFMYVIIFSIFMQNLSKAIVLVSYDDASQCHEQTKVQEENRKRAAESDNNDCLARVWKQLQVVRRFFTKLDRGTAYDKGRLMMKYETQKTAHRSSSTLLYLVYCIMYMIMTFQQVQIYWANALTRSLSSAIEVPTFEKTNPISGQINTKNNFSTIGTREDVMLFLQQVLPKTLFNSSVGTFEMEPNPLKLYQSAKPPVEQLVINNWNIVVGRTTPVRMSFKFANMTRVGEEAALGNLVSADTMKLQSSSAVTNAAREFSPPFLEATGDSILNAKAREFLKRHGCNYSLAYAADSPEDRNGYACMLSRDYATTIRLLTDMYDSNIITRQTAVVAIDFVIYNGYAEAFVYVAITFGFQPSGAITKDVTTFTIRLDLYTSSTVFRVMLEVLVIFITCFYLAQSFSHMYRDVSEFRKDLRERDARAQTCPQRTLSNLRGIILHFVLDPFNLLDLVSSVMTVITMVLWYNVVLMKLRGFYFSERPEWDASDSGPWQSDSEVLHDFFWAGRSLRWFIRFCAVNTVVILFRLLKYLQIFSRVRMMFKTIARGIQDIFYFIVMMFVILMGYVMMGYQLFGSRTRDFSSMVNSIIACFEMFLGTFDYAQLRMSGRMASATFSYTFVILFRYMLTNMFFAIIDKSFQEEDEQEREKLEKLAGDKPEEPRSSSHRPAAYMRAFSPLRRVFLRGSHATDAAHHVEDEGHMDHDDEPGLSHSLAPGEGTLAVPESHGGGRRSVEMPSDPDEGDLHQLAIADDTTEPHEVKGDLSEGVVKRVHAWKYLPPEMQGWALQTSTHINGRIDEWQRKRQDCVDKKEEHDLDRILNDAESSIKVETNRRWREALSMKKDLQKEELKKLKEIHNDQEALAWYIMKREAELKKLEQAKTRKQERLDEIVQAAKSLISSGDDDGVKALEDKK